MAGAACFGAGLLTGLAGFTTILAGADFTLELAAALAAQYDHDVHLNIEVDPSVLGGMSIRVGDEEIDGTIVRRLADIRRRIERAS